MILGSYPYTLHVNKRYSISHVIEYFNNWFAVSDGSYRASDLGVDTDKRYSTITVEDSVDNINLLEHYLTDLSLGAIDPVTATIEEGEDIFGCEVLYSNPLTVRVLGTPKFSYKSLGWASLTFKLELVQDSSYNLKGDPTGIGWEDMTWNFSVSRNLVENKKDIFYYSKPSDVAYDGAKSRVVTSTFTLTKDQAVWLKLYLLHQRTQEFLIPNTLFTLDNNTSVLSVPVKAKRFSEVRESELVYSVKVEFLVYE